MELILACILVAFAAYFNAKMDKCTFHGVGCNAGEWKNKWKLDSDGKLIPYSQKWYHFKIFQPKYVEKFPFSSTLLVAFTDNWHRWKSLFLICLFAAMVVLTYDFSWQYAAINFLILRTVFGLTFTLFFDKILK